MLAFSAPLNLWAPSSLLIRNASQIGPKAFVRYVETGLIRVHGRANWLTDRRFRDSHRWPEAAWDAEIDDALDSIRREDEVEPEDRRRVVVAQPEEGFRLAAEYLDRFPDQIDRWNRILRGPTARSKLPSGTRESALRYHDDGPLAVAKAILRDAFNHGLAIRGSGADAPLLLSSADKQFLKLLEETWAPSAQRPAGAPPLTLSGELGGQLVDVLRYLDIHRGPQNLDRFLQGNGRRLLVAWLKDICQRYREVNPRDIDSVIITELRAQLGQGTFTQPIRDALTHPLTTSAGLVGLVLTAAELVQEPSNAFAVTGMAASVVQVTGAAAKQFGITPASYNGPQWPFLYAYRAQARPRQVARLKHILNEFGSA